MDEPFNVRALSFTESDTIMPAAPDVLDDEDADDIPAGVPRDQRGLFRRIVSEKERPRQRRTPKAARPVPPKPKAGTLVKPLTDFYTSIGTMMLPFDQPCAMAVINNATECAESLENLARENPKVRRALLAMVETSVWGQVIAAHAPIMLAIAMHHVPAVRDNMGPTPTLAHPDSALNGHPHG